MSLSKVGGCSHSHFLRPFCSQQTSSEKIQKVFLFALGAVIVWIYFRPNAKSFTPRTSELPSEAVAKKPIDKASTFFRPKSTPLQPVPSSSTLSTPFLKSADEIDQLPQKLGVSLDIIQRRAKPASLKGGDTFKGFLDQNDSLLAVIKKDWEQVEKEKITHAQVADHIHNILEAARKTQGVAVSYDMEKSDGVPSDVIPKFSVVFFTKSEQETDTNIFRPEDARREEGSSTEEAIICNTAVPCKYIRWTPVRESYIRLYGFYSLGMELEIILGILKGKPVSFN